MKKSYLVIGSIAFFQFLAKAQESTTSPPIPKVNKTEVELVYNHYLQDGDNSAITGGIGTEKLSVYAPALTINKTFNKNTLSFKLGADIISSASTDNIDYIKSSASILDTRSYSNFTYGRKLKNQDISIYGGGGFSLESDYLSIGSKLGFTKQDERKLLSYFLEFQMFNDDLRWGRLSSNNRKPVKLIYPSELRHTEWFDIYRRHSFNLKGGFNRAINKRNIAGIYPVLTYQSGLLSTPFHRIFFNDGTRGVEQLPNQRLKLAVALKLNTFVAGNIILKNTVNGYSDNFGILAISLENEAAFKIKTSLVLLSDIRFYTQKGSKYFKPYLEHDPSDSFFTSDYDLSNIQTYSLGLGMKYKPNKSLNERIILKTMTLRYNFLYRSNDLSAHTISLAFNIEATKPSADE